MSCSSSLRISPAVVFVGLYAARTTAGFVSGLVLNNEPHQTSTHRGRINGSTHEIEWCLLQRSCARGLGNRPEHAVLGSIPSHCWRLDRRANRSGRHPIRSVVQDLVATISLAAFTAGDTHGNFHCPLAARRSRLCDVPQRQTSWQPPGLRSRSANSPKSLPLTALPQPTISIR